MKWSNAVIYRMLGIITWPVINLGMCPCTHVPRDFCHDFQHFLKSICGKLQDNLLHFLNNPHLRTSPQHWPLLRPYRCWVLSFHLITTLHRARQCRWALLFRHAKNDPCLTYELFTCIFKIVSTLLGLYVGQQVCWVISTRFKSLMFAFKCDTTLNW